ncbi:MAG TPA: YeeE/YedE thiosulfate transporter family protein [Balneolales bacterium]|nr:YeeE/YedE thiosulfate transporter family protein [Balneolales bacterium]
MNAPLFKFGLFGNEVSLIVAFIIGIGFGFFLERAGFGSARKLAAQFYFRDMAVFKVMFTAIITAMLGLFYLSWIGWVDLSQVYLVPTNVWPDLLGGLILGVGFVIGGYCPGTSCVAGATGKVDGYWFILGLVFGIFAFGEAYPWISDFYNSSYMGQITLPQLFNISYGVLVFVVVLIALGGFLLAEKVEKYFAKKDAEAAR